MERTWRGTWAGILTIIGGCIGIGVGAGAAAIIGTLGLGEFAGVPGLGALIGAPLIVMGIIALIAGIYTLRRKAWGFALTGAILALPCSLPLLLVLAPVFILGILAIIFVFMGKREFA